MVKRMGEGRRKWWWLIERRRRKRGLLSLSKIKRKEGIEGMRGGVGMRIGERVRMRMYNNHDHLVGNCIKAQDSSFRSHVPISRKCCRDFM